MAGNNICAPERFQHSHRNFTGKSTVIFIVAILRDKPDIARPDSFSYLRQSGKSRSNTDLTTMSAFSKLLENRRSKVTGLGNRLVHFPVTYNNFFPHN